MADGPPAGKPPPPDPLARLAEERATTAVRIEQLTRNFDAIVAAAKDTATDDEHDPEGQTIAFERSQVQALLAQAREHLGRLDAAVERLSAGVYATCEQCGRPIGAERLVARPTATTCITCASLPRR